jgi:hypothetical protein
MTVPVLPPKLTGPSRGKLEIRLSHFRPNGDRKGIKPSERQKELVRVLWWGYNSPQLIEIDKDTDTASITYDIVTTDQVKLQLTFRLLFQLIPSSNFRPSAHTSRMQRNCFLKYQTLPLQQLDLQFTISCMISLIKGMANVKDLKYLMRMASF